jgi:hypothetical protein
VEETAEGKYSAEGVLVGGQPQCKGDSYDYVAHFKLSRALAAGDVWKMKVLERGRSWVVTL